MKNINSSKGAECAGKIGTTRSPMAGNLAQPGKLELNPPTGANTTTPGISRTTAPIQSPMNGGRIVKY